MREEWTAFFSREQEVLQNNYPGLNLHRFLMEVLDLLKLKDHPQISLDHSRYSFSIADTKALQRMFLQGIPFAYLTNHSEFYKHSFYINNDVLIPRSETELMVDLLVKQGHKRVFNRALDVGTGSGVIILSLLASQSVLTGIASDISADALIVAKINSRRLRLEDRCEFLLSDRLENIKGPFDLIVSNPPYIKQRSHAELVHGKVDEFEPGVALYLSDADYENWFAKFFKQISHALTPEGIFMMEGHELELEHQAQQLRQLKFQEVEVLQDFAGLNRFLMAKAPLPI